MKTLINALTIALAFGLSGSAQAAFTGDNGYFSTTYYSNPHTNETLVSFDWDADTNLYYTTGRPSYGLGFSAYKYDGATISNLYTDSGVFAGSRITRIGDYVYFNDGGDYGRWTYDYFKYDTASATAPTQIIDSALSGADLWGLQARGTSNELWASGGSSSTIRYTTLDGEGNPQTVALISLGTIGNASGPMAFDSDGNLYYASGYVSAGNPSIYRWTAAEVAAAVSDPSGSPLTPTGHEWASIEGGFTGATGMACDDDGNVIVTVTAFGSPSEVRIYRVDNGRTKVGMLVIATTPNRAEAVRYRGGMIYVSDLDGIAIMTLSLTATPFAVIDTVYDNPHDNETLVSFDWDADTNLYYTTGRPSYGLGFSAYKYDGATISNLYTDSGVFAGSRITRIGDYVYFNDGGDYGRWTYDYFKYDTASATAPTQIIDSALSGADLWGLQARGTSNELWASGGSSSTIRYTTLDGEGNPQTVALISLGTIGNASGPMAFDSDGNLYYASGYVSAGNPSIYRWTAAEVAAAVSDPSGSPLTPTGHEWASIEGGFTGATGMACDDDGNVIVTVTAFGSPGEVRMYDVGANGSNNGMVVIATTPNRAETVRCRNGVIYVSHSDGISAITLSFIAAPGANVNTVFANPHDNETLVSFDWDADTNLYYTTGRPSYALGFSAYKYDGVTISNLYTDSGVFTGSRITRIGDYVYFNDGGDYGRWTYDYFKYDTASATAPTQIIDSALSGADLWGLQARGTSNELWASGGSSSTIRYTTLDGEGNPQTVALISLGAIGNASGPMAFDSDGNLYYASGYVSAGNPSIYRWTAAEVAAAVSDPSGSPLTPTGHEWASIEGGFTGATGMACDDDGNVIVTVTAFGSPGEVRRYLVAEDGANIAVDTLAISAQRAETVRAVGNTVYFSNAKGIYALDSIVVLAESNTVSISEGSNSTFNVKLSAPPFGTVTVSIRRASGDSDISVSGGSILTFNASNWNVYQTVTLVAAEDDTDNIDGVSTIICELNGGGAFSAEIEVTEIDDDYTLSIDSVTGTVIKNPDQPYYDRGSSVNLTAGVAPYYTFTGWSGDTQGDTNSFNMTVDMLGPRELTANYTAALATNGVPVAWRDTHGLSDADLLLDPFGKGMPIWQEFYAGTDPNNSNSVFRIIDVGVSSSSNYVTWVGGTNGSTLPFSILGSSDLMRSWVIVNSSVERSPTGTNTWWSNVATSNTFYRIDVEW